MVSLFYQKILIVTLPETGTEQSSFALSGYYGVLCAER